MAKLNLLRQRHWRSGNDAHGLPCLAKLESGVPKSNCMRFNLRMWSVKHIFAPPAAFLLASAMCFLSLDCVLDMAGRVEPPMCCDASCVALSYMIQRYFGEQIL